MNKKPFDLEAAKRGEPIVTRDGRPAKLLHHLPTAEENQRVIAAVYNASQGTPDCCRLYYEDGAFTRRDQSELDLFMVNAPAQPERLPFDLEKALDGHLLVTSDGEEAELVGYRSDVQPFSVVAAVGPIGARSYRAFSSDGGDELFLARVPAETPPPYPYDEPASKPYLVEVYFDGYLSKHRRHGAPEVELLVSVAGIAGAHVQVWHGGRSVLTHGQ